MPDMNGVAKIQVLDDRGCVCGVMIHVVTVRHLAGTAMAAAIDADHPVAALDEEQHLSVPVVGAQWPAVMEDDRLPLAPVLVEDVHAVRSCDRAHAISPSFVRRWSVEGLCESAIPRRPVDNIAAAFQHD